MPRDGHLRRRHASTASRSRFKTTVHGPVVGYATVDGKRVAISRKRSSYGKEVLDLLFNRKLSNGSVRDPKSFFRAANKTPQTFNSFYIDNKHVAEFTSGLLPIRPEERRSGPADLGHREVRVGGLPLPEPPHAGRRSQPTGR